jgi:putative PEP-CTERM system integral membrane protein
MKSQHRQPSAKPGEPGAKPGLAKSGSLLFLLFFWAFNASLLTVAYLGLVPFLGIALMTDMVSGLVPWDFFLPFVGLVGVPATCTFVGALPKQKRPITLPQLFWGLEAPLLCFCLIRFFWLRDLNPATSLLLLTGLVGLVSYAHWLRSQSIEASGLDQAGLDQAGQSNRVTTAITGWHLVGLALMLLLAAYGTALIAFYVVPFLVAVVMALPQLPLVLLYGSILLPLLVLVGGLLVSPIGALWVYGRAWWYSVNQFPAGRSWASVLTMAIIGGWLWLALVLNQPPQTKAFELLATPATTPQARQALLQQQDLIRRGLVNAYLGPYRYPRQVGDAASGHIYGMYRYSLGEQTATAIQNAYNTLLTPFTYQGDRSADATKASDLYGQFFDTPLLRAEKDAVKNALESTFNRTEAKAGLIDVNERRVWLAEQQLTLKPAGDWADVELYEVYENQTLDQQEILYFFSLPESAVITGLWLGETGDRSKSFPYTVSPRGAAQQVYNAEVTRRQDPALLEQVGPRQYRLRAFPIPRLGQGKMHLWMTYKVLQQEAGWALPELSEQRNIFWTNQTKRTLNGEAVKAKTWLPNAPDAGQFQPVAHQMSLTWSGQGSNQENVQTNAPKNAASQAQIIAKPFAASDYKLPQGKHFAVVVDGSYSMNAHEAQLKETLQWLQSQVLTQNTADFYMTTAAPAQPQRQDSLKQFSLPEASFYSTIAPSDMLQQFLDLRGDTQYDAVLMLTDAGSYELTADRPQALAMPAPLWLVHLGGLQPTYDDATLAAIQNSGGGVATQAQEVMQRIGTQPSLGPNTTNLNVIDGYAWYLTKSPLPDAKTDPNFTQLAARQWVTHLSQYVKPSQLQELDTIHAITKKAGIVSPYSSMLVLVNDDQRQALRQAEQSQDRFNREVEDQQLPQPSELTAVSATPEPAEWMLLLAAVILLGWRYRQQRADSVS